VASKKSQGGNIALMVLVLIILHVILMLNFEPYAEVLDTIYQWLKVLANRS
jgi:hypothetical protein